MKTNSIIVVLVFLFLPGTHVAAQNGQTGVKNEITKHSKELDDLEGKKIQQQTLSTTHFEKLDTTTKAVKTRFHVKKPLYKKRRRNRK